MDVIGQKEPIKVDERYLSEIIEARMEQILAKSKAALEEIDALTLPGGVILTGGNASIPGIVELAADVFGTHVKLHVPNHMGLRNPIFSNAISIVEYGSQLNEIYHISKAAVTGGKLSVSQTNDDVRYEAPRQVEQETAQQTVDYDDYEEEEPKGKNVKSKLTDFISNIFD